MKRLTHCKNTLAFASIRTVTTEDNYDIDQQPSISTFSTTLNEHLKYVRYTPALTGSLTDDFDYIVNHHSLNRLFCESYFCFPENKHKHKIKKLTGLCYQL